MLKNGTKVKIKPTSGIPEIEGKIGTITGIAMIYLLNPYIVTFDEIICEKYPYVSISIIEEQFEVI